MKATELVKGLQAIIKNNGEDIEVFIEVAGFNAEAIHDVKSAYPDEIQVSDLSKYPKEMVTEDWRESEDEEPDEDEGQGLVKGAVICVGSHVSTNG